VRLGAPAQRLGAVVGLRRRDDHAVVAGLFRRGYAEGKLFALVPAAAGIDALAAGQPLQTAGLLAGLTVDDLIGAPRAPAGRVGMENHMHRDRGAGTYGGRAMPATVATVDKNLVDGCMTDPPGGGRRDLVRRSRHGECRCADGGKNREPSLSSRAGHDVLPGSLGSLVAAESGARQIARPRADVESQTVEIPSRNPLP
jgi:hypothetical protein